MICDVVYCYSVKWAQVRGMKRKHTLTKDYRNFNEHLSWSWISRVIIIQRWKMAKTMNVAENMIMFSHCIVRSSSWCGRNSIPAKWLVRCYFHWMIILSVKTWLQFLSRKGYIAIIIDIDLSPSHTHTHAADYGKLLPTDYHTTQFF